jgi:hypothetical protein
MQPSPIADTSRLLFPSFRFCIVSPLMMQITSVDGSTHALPATSKTRRASAEMWTTRQKQQKVVEHGLG